MKKIYVYLFVLTAMLLRATALHAQEPYSVLSGDGTVLTFYYDAQKAARGGMDVGSFYYDYWEKAPTTSWYGNSNTIEEVVFDPSFANCTSLTSTSYWFYGCEKLSLITGIENFNTRNVTEMYEMFRGCKGLTILDLRGLNTAKVTDMSSMFFDCSGLRSLNVSGFNTANVTTMEAMFYNCESLESLDLSSFNTANVSQIKSMFSGCKALESLDLSGFNTDKVTNMINLFKNCTSLTSLDVSGFNTQNVTDMSCMFQGCSCLQSLDLRGFNTFNVSNMYAIFKDCKSLTSIYVSKNWRTSFLSYDDLMFSGCTNLVGWKGTAFDPLHTNKSYARIDGGDASPGYLSEKVEPYAVLSADGTVLTFYYDTQKVDRGGMDVVPFSTTNGWNEHRGTITTVVFDPSFADYTSLPSTAYWFKEYSNLTTIAGMENLNTQNVTDMSHMFYGCSSLTSLDVSGFNTSNVTDMSAMFEGCTSLQSLDLRNFDTSNVTDMGAMFKSCSSLTSLDVSSFNTIRVRDMNSMFSGCNNLPSLDLGSFNTIGVTNMNSMFAGCYSLTSLDISTFNTAKVKDMNYMFVGCIKLKTIYASSKFTTKNNQYGDNLFAGCMILVGGQGTVCTEMHSGDNYARIDGGGKAPGYFTAGNEPYAVLSDDGTVLTFCYDAQKAERNGMDVIGPFYIEDDWDPTTSWYRNRNTITTVVFDPSFANCTTVTTTAFWFYGCDALTTINGLENFNTKNLYSTNYMFKECSALKSLDLSSFNTSNLLSMRDMFSGCRNLESLDLSSFDTSNLTDITYTFEGCKNLTTIYAGDGWTTENVIDHTSTFAGCEKLVGGQGTTFSSSHIDASYARLDGGTAAPGYFSEKSEEIVVGLGDTANILRRNANAPIYDLSGRRLAAPKKGVNIVGGRKVVVK